MRYDIKHTPAECWAGCTDSDCHYVHLPSWEVNGEVFNNEDDAKKAAAWGFVVTPTNSLDFSGKVIVTDPCYILNQNGMWEEFINEYFKVCGSVVLEYNGLKMLIVATWDGDGVYEVQEGGSFGVDAGLMCVANIDDLFNAGLDCRSLMPGGDIAWLAAIHDINGTVKARRGYFEGVINVDTENYDEDDDWESEHYQPFDEDDDENEDEENGN